jgi:hypothetical protein
MKQLNGTHTPSPRFDEHRRICGGEDSAARGPHHAQHRGLDRSRGWVGIAPDGRIFIYVFTM